MQRKTLLGSARIPPGQPAYSPGVTFDLGKHKLIFLSGQIAVDDDGETVAPNDAAAQTRFIFERIQSLLSKANASLDDLLKVQIFVTDMADLDAVSRVRNRYLSESLPVSTLVEVNALVRPDCCVEIDAIAIGSV